MSERALVFAIGLVASSASGIPSMTESPSGKIETDVSRYVWESQTAAGATVNEAMAVRVKAVAPKCRVNRTYIKSREGTRAVFTEESVIEPGFVGESSSYRSTSPEASLIKIEMRAAIDLSGYSIGSVTPEAFEEAVKGLSDQEVQEAAAGQTVSISTGGGKSFELRGIEDDERLAERIVERLDEREGVAGGLALMSREATRQLAALLRIMWTQERGILLFSKENLLIEVLQEIHPEVFEEESQVSEQRLSVRVEPVQEDNGVRTILEEWAADFGLADPMWDTCMAGGPPESSGMN